MSDEKDIFDEVEVMEKNGQTHPVAIEETPASEPEEELRYKYYDIDDARVATLNTMGKRCKKEAKKEMLEIYKQNRERLRLIKEVKGKLKELKEEQKAQKMLGKTMKESYRRDK